MVDWQAIVRKVGRSRTDFTITTWDDEKLYGKIIRLTCNCCGAWVQRQVPDEVFVRAYYPEEVYEYVIRELIHFMLRIDTERPFASNADRRPIEGSRPHIAAS